MRRHISSDRTWPLPSSMYDENLSSACIDAVRLFDDLQAGADFVDRAAAVGFAEVQEQRSRGDQGRDVRRVAVLEDARDEVREAVQHVFAVDRLVGRQAAVADEALEPRLPRADQPGVRRAHRVAVAADACRPSPPAG